MNESNRKMFERSFQRPKDFFSLDPRSQWAIDNDLGILDWDGKGMTPADKRRYRAHYLPNKKEKRPSVAPDSEKLLKENKNLRLLIKQALKMAFKDGPDYYGKCPKADLARKMKIAVGIDPNVEEDHG